MIAPRIIYNDSEIKKILSRLVVLVDTREKENRHIKSYFELHNIKFAPHTLNCGDYSVMLPSVAESDIKRDIYFDKSIIIERKASLDELSTNLSSERTRFENEFLRAGNAKKFLIIEDATYDNIIFHDYNTKLSEKAFLASLLSFQERYNLNVCFASKGAIGQIIYGVLYYHVRNYLLS